jgi:DNA-binding transcriptional regulator YiaG
MDLDILGDAIERARTRRRLPTPTTRRLVRERSGISQSALARALGVSSAAVCRWESGDRTPRGELLVVYLDALARLEREALA